MKLPLRPIPAFRQVIWAAAAVLLLLGGAAAAAGPSFEGYVGKFIVANPPQAAPQTPFQDSGGVAHSLAEFKGKAVLVNFWATWCQACLMEMAGLDRLQAELGAKGLVVLTISQEGGGGGDAPRRYLEKQNLKHLPAHRDEKRRLGLAFNQRLLPTSMLLDVQGREVGRLVGPADWTSPQAKALIGRYLPNAP